MHDPEDTGNDDHGGIHDPDWDRYRVDSRALQQSDSRHSPLGDPSQWGRQVTSTIRSGPNSVLHLAPIVRAQCNDAYSRAWMVVGNLDVPTELWTTLDVQWDVGLVIRQGAGQNTIMQRLSIRKLTDLALASGVYLPVTHGTRQTRPWVMTGGIYANALAISVDIAFITEGPPQEYTVLNEMQIAPLNAGSGL